MITLKITHSDGERVITLGAETMKELIDEKLPAWLPKFKNEEEWLKKTKGFKIYGKSFLAAEKKSGWYYDC